LMQQYLTLLEHHVSMLVGGEWQDGGA